MKFRTNLAAAILTAAVLAGGVAHAEQNDKASEISALAAAKLDAAAAIAAVEKLGNGRVVELTLEGHGAAVTYAVTLQADDGTETNYVVDAVTGAVVQTGEAWSNDEPAGGDGDGEVGDDGANGAQDGGDGDGETAD